MSFGLSAAAVGMIGIGTGVAGAALSANASKKQAKLQANAISEAGEIDQAARNKAVSQVLEIFGPSLVDFNESMQGSIDLMGQGRISTGDLLTQSASNASEIVRRGGQSALNAMLGIPQQQAQQQPAQIAQQPAQQPVTGGIKPPKDPTRPVARDEGIPQNLLPPPVNVEQVQSLATDGGMGIQPSVSPQRTGIPGMIDRATVQPGVTPQRGGIPGMVDAATQNLMANTNQAGVAEPSFAVPTDAQGNQYRFMGDQSPINQDTRIMGDQVGQPSGANFTLPDGYDKSKVGPFNIGPYQKPSAYQPTDPLVGEFLPRDYNFNQQGVTMPQGSNAGLLGAEQAIRSGADLGRSDLTLGAIGAIDSMGRQTGIARQDIGQGRDFALNKIQQGIQAGRAGIDAGVGAIQSGVGQATGYLQPYMSAGQEALNPLLALSGVRGQEAFDAARMNDPAYNLALQESERALGRNAAVTGGIGSGNVMGRFQLNAQQQAAADIDRQLGRFRAITDRGQQAAGTAGGFATQGGIASGQLQARGGELEANQLNRMGDVGIQSSQDLSMLAQQLGMTEAQVMQSLGSNLANIDVGTGQQIGGMREQAGINAANLIQGTAGQQAGIDQGLAQSLAGLDQTTLNNIINSIQSGAGTNLQSQQQLATTLANLGIGAGTSAAQTAIDLGQAQAAGVTNPIGNAINTGIGLYASGAFNPSPVTTPGGIGAQSPNTFQPWSPTNLGGQ